MSLEEQTRNFYMDYFFVSLFQHFTNLLKTIQKCDGEKCEPY
jgi:hypothetical protein